MRPSIESASDGEAQSSLTVHEVRCGANETVCGHGANRLLLDCKSGTWPPLESIKLKPCAISACALLKRFAALIFVGDSLVRNLFHTVLTWAALEGHSDFRSFFARHKPTTFEGKPFELSANGCDGNGSTSEKCADGFWRNDTVWRHLRKTVQSGTVCDGAVPVHFSNLLDAEDLSKFTQVIFNIFIYCDIQL